MAESLHILLGTSACLQWLCHSGEQTVARGPLVIMPPTSFICPFVLLTVHLSRFFVIILDTCMLHFLNLYGFFMKR